MTYGNYYDKTRLRVTPSSGICQPIHEGATKSLELTSCEAYMYLESQTNDPNGEDPLVATSTMISNMPGISAYYSDK